MARAPRAGVRSLQVLVVGECGAAQLAAALAPAGGLLHSTIEPLLLRPR